MIRNTLCLGLILGLVSLAMTGVHADPLTSCDDESLTPQARLDACQAVLAATRLDRVEAVVAHRGSAVALMGMGMIDRGFGEIALALSLDPENVRTRLARAALFAAEAKPELARRDYRFVLRRDPSNAAAQQGCLVALNALGHEDEGARRSLDHACALINGQTPSAPGETGEPVRYVEGDTARRNLESTLAQAGITRPRDLDALRYSAVEGADPVANQRLLDAVALAAAADIYGAASAYADAGKRDSRTIRCGFRGAMHEAAMLMRLYDRSVRPDAYGDALMPRSLEELNVVLLAQPTDPGALRERVLIYAAVKAWELAFDDLELALVSDPRTQEVYVLYARLMLIMQSFLDAAVMNALITHEPIPGPSDGVAFYGAPLRAIQEAYRRGAQGAFVEVTRGEAFLALAQYLDDDDLYRQAQGAFDLAITYVRDPGGVSELDSWSAGAAMWQRSSVKFHVEDQAFLDDMEDAVVLFDGGIQKGCPDHE